MMAPIPEPYVEASLSGGPHAGETVMLPWARYHLPMQRWVEGDLLVSWYQLAGPWRGQAEAAYAWLPVEEEAAASLKNDIPSSNQRPSRFRNLSAGQFSRSQTCVSILGGVLGAVIVETIRAQRAQRAQRRTA